MQGAVMCSSALCLAGGSEAALYGSSAGLIAAGLVQLVRLRGLDCRHGRATCLLRFAPSWCV